MYSANIILPSLDLSMSVLLNTFQYLYPSFPFMDHSSPWWETIKYSLEASEVINHGLWVREKEQSWQQLASLNVTPK